MTAKSHQQWVLYAKKNRKVLIYYGTCVIDMTMFAYIHPGGKSIIKQYQLQDVSKTIYKLYGHDPVKTQKTLMKNKCGELIKEVNQNQVVKQKVLFPKKRKISIKKSRENQTKQQSYGNLPIKEESQIYCDVSYHEEGPNIVIPVFVPKFLN